METNAKGKKMIVLGFALFAMFFGAGNLIFPPYLGLTSGENWFAGFASFIIIDAGLAVVALLAISRSESGLEGILNKAGGLVALLLMAANAICLGPLVAIPRTAATTFELAVQPLVPGCPAWLSGIAFFLLVAVLCIRPAKIVDIVGKVLSPIMLVSLGILIVKGAFVFSGVPAGGDAVSVALKNGLEAGYQTMDMMGALLFSVVVMASVKGAGYAEGRASFRAVAGAGGIAAAGLFLVYGGLSFLGAASAGRFSPELGQSGLLLAITNELLGGFGAVLLGIIVASACLTTAIGLVSSSAECFVSLFKGRLSYKPLVIAICAISCVIANFGLSTIISLAAPVLELIYPVLMTLVLLSFLSKYIKGAAVYRMAALFAFAASAYALLDGLFPIALGAELLPLSGLGLGWVLPAMAGAAIGALANLLGTKRARGGSMLPVANAPRMR